MLVKYHVELIAYRGEYMERAEARGKQAWVDEARRVWEDEVQMMSQGTLVRGVSIRSASG